MRFLALCLLLLSMAGPLLSEDTTRLKLNKNILPPVDVSVTQEADRAIDKALQWLASKQTPEGYWSIKEFPGLTAFAVTAFCRSPKFSRTDPLPESLSKGLVFLASCRKEEGGIYATGYPNYNTCLAIMAMVAAGRPEDQAAIASARAFVVSLQDDTGGIGYGGTERRDINNTAYAIEALRLSAYVNKDTGQTQDVQWDKAIAFLQKCQNLPSHNSEPWVSDAPNDLGGFIYRPEDSKAGSEAQEGGKTLYRSYGSATFSGLLGLLYAEVDPNDPRVLAGVDWVKRNYSVEENPGLGHQGLYYYYYAMAKALSLAGQGILDLPDGRRAHWRQELLEKLISIQKNEGFWINDTGRWMEDDPTLVTCYALLAMEAALANPENP